MTFTLNWMPSHAPYMPIATAGLLALLERAGHDATAWWAEDGAGRVGLQVDTALDVLALGELIADSPWPDESLIAWPGGNGRGRAQALKPLLRDAGQPLPAFRRMVRTAPPLEAELLRAILSDGVLDGDGIPARSILLRGVKSDLTSAFKRPRRITADAIDAELRGGLAFRSDATGLGLGLVPEVQTFGGSTGPDPSSIDSYSPLLYLLLWNGFMALPPVPVRDGGRRVVGGPLVTDPDTISWPRWRIPADLASLRTLFSLAAIHADRPDLALLGRRGVDRVYRSRTIPLNNTISVFRWGEEVGA